MRNLKKLLALTIVLALAVSITLPAFAVPVADFNDGEDALAFIKERDDAAPGDATPYAAAVQLMVDLGVIKGKGPVGSAPADMDLALRDPLTRIEFLVMLYRALNGGQDIEADRINWANVPPVFTDTPAGWWGTSYATWGYTLGVTQGTTPGVIFSPNRPIVVHEAILMCMRAIAPTVASDGFAYSLVNVLWLANRLNLYSYLDWNEDLSFTRADACLLLEGTIRTGELTTATEPNTLWRAASTGQALLTTAFGYTEFTGTVMSDGRWFALGGAPGDDGRAIFNDGSNTVILTSATTAALGIDMYSVGHRVNFFYRTVGGATPHVNVREVFGFRKLSSEKIWTGLGEGDSRWDHTTLLTDVRAVSGNGNLNFGGLSALYINYRTAATLDAILLTDSYDPDTSLSYTNAAMTGTPMRDAMTLANFDQGTFDESDFRVIWFEDTVLYVFAEIYQFVQFRRFYSDNDNKLQFAEGLTNDRFGQDSATQANIKYFDADKMQDNHFLIYEIGTTRWGFKEVAKTTARVTRVDGGTITFGGRNYVESDIIFNGTGTGNPAVAGFPLTTGGEFVFYTLGNSVLLTRSVPGAPPPELHYAVVRNSRIQTVTNPGSGLSGDVYTVTFWVNLLFANGDSGDFQLVKGTNGKSNTAEINGDPVIALDESVPQTHPLVAHGQAMKVDGTPLNEILFQVEMKENSLVQLSIPDYTSGPAFTDTAIPSGYDSDPNAIRTVWPAGTGGLTGKFITGSSVHFLRVTNDGGTWIRVAGNTLPMINAGGSVDAPVQAAFGRLAADGDNLAITVAAIVLTGAGAGAPGVLPPAPPTNWALALGTPFLSWEGDANRHTLKIMDNTGAVRTIFADNATRFNTLAANSLIVFGTDGDGWVNSVAIDATPNQGNKLEGINTELKLFFVAGHPGNPPIAYPAPKEKAQFFFIDGDASRLITEGEVAGVLHNDGNNWRIYAPAAPSDTNIYFIFKP
jgi:hypothetical protein